MNILLEYDNDETTAEKTIEKLVRDFRLGETLYFAVYPDTPEGEAIEPEIIAATIDGVTEEF